MIKLKIMLYQGRKSTIISDKIKNKNSNLNSINSKFNLIWVICTKNYTS